MKVIIAALMVMLGATLTPAAASTSGHRHAKVEYIYLDQKDTDGQPMLVASSTISHVHRCHHGTCLATLAGYNKLVWVRR